MVLAKLQLFSHLPPLKRLIIANSIQNIAKKQYIIEQSPEISYVTQWKQATSKNSPMKLHIRQEIALTAMYVYVNLRPCRRIYLIDFYRGQQCTIYLSIYLSINYYFAKHGRASALFQNALCGEMPPKKQCRCKLHRHCQSKLYYL